MSKWSLDLRNGAIQVLFMALLLVAGSTVARADDGSRIVSKCESAHNTIKTIEGIVAGSSYQYADFSGLVDSALAEIQAAKGLMAQSTWPASLSSDEAETNRRLDKTLIYLGEMHNPVVYSDASRAQKYAYVAELQLRYGLVRLHDHESAISLPDASTSTGTTGGTTTGGTTDTGGTTTGGTDTGGTTTGGTTTTPPVPPPAPPAGTVLDAMQDGYDHVVAVQQILAGAGFVYGTYAGEADNAVQDIDVALARLAAANWPSSLDGDKTVIRRRISRARENLSYLSGSRALSAKKYTLKYVDGAEYQLRAAGQILANSEPAPTAGTTTGTGGTTDTGTTDTGGTTTGGTTTGGTTTTAPPPAPPPPPPPTTVTAPPGTGSGVPAALPSLTSGTGFTAATGQVAAIGSGAGSNAKAIARWDVVPYQTFSSDFQIGVVAFHMNDIDRVDFSANGGPWVSAGLAYNSRSGAHEYAAKLPIANFSDGLVEVRAVVYPKVGLPRVLAGPRNANSRLSGDHSLFIWCNAGNTLRTPVRYVDANNGDDSTGNGSASNPYRTAYKALQEVQNTNGGTDGADGTILYLQPGFYSWGPPAWPYPNTVNRWAVVRPAPGVSKSQVVFTASGDGFRTDLVKLENITIQGTTRLGITSGANRNLWIDNCEMIGPGRQLSFELYFAGNWTGGLFMTDSTMRDYRNGATACDIARNVVVNTISSDAYTMTKLLVNCAVDDIDDVGTPNHTDIYQFAGTGFRENHIIYGLQATNCEAQGLFADDLSRIDNVAFVNFLMAKPINSNWETAPFSQWAVPCDHMVMRGGSFAGTTMFFRQQNMTNISIEGTLFYKAMEENPGWVNGSWFKDCHFTSTNSMNLGTGSSTGNPGFISAQNANFRPATGSVLRNRIQNSMHDVDLDGTQRSAPDTVGAYK